MIRPLHWDSNFFGFKTGRIDTSDTHREDLLSSLKTISKSGFELVYVFAPHEDDILRKEITDLGGFLVDEKITYSANISGLSAETSEYIVSCLGTEMDKDLEILAIESGKYSRFRTDPKIPSEKFEDLYRLWMKNSLNGTFAHEVFAYSVGGRRQGMVSVAIRNGEGWIGIIAVNETFRGKSVGRNLMHAAAAYCKSNHIDILNVQTQLQNNVSCLFYERLGFRKTFIEDVYHIWIA